MLPVCVNDEEREPPERRGSCGGCQGHTRHARAIMAFPT
jgi:hypothetical protein